RFLVANAFSTPKELLLPEILNRIEPSGAADRVLNAQRGLLSSLLSESRIKRMEDHQLLSHGSSYSVRELVTEVPEGILSELTQPNPVVDLYRQNLQRAYLSTMKGRLSGDGASQTTLRPIGTGALKDLAHQIDQALPKVKDRLTALHLQACRKD